MCAQYSVQIVTKGENRRLVTEDKSYTLTVMREEVVWVWDCERKIEKDQ